MELTNQNNHLDDTDILDLENLYAGYLHKDNKNIFTIFLEKIIDGKRMMKAITNENKQLYSINTNSDEEYIKSLTPLDIMLSDNLAFLKGEILEEKESYKNQLLCKIARIIDNYSKQTEEEKAQIESVIDVVVNWWADAVCYPTFDNGDKSEIGAITMLLASIIDAEKGIPSKDIINKFKTYLGNEVRKELFDYPDDCYCTLSVDYQSEGSLNIAAKKANLNANFPWKTTMWIHRNEVSVCIGDSPRCEIVYDIKENKVAQKSKN